MKTVFGLLFIFLVIGLLARKYNNWTRLALLVAIAGMVLYVTFA